MSMLWKESFFSLPKVWYAQVLKMATENVVACPLHDTPRWWPTLRGLTRTPPLKMKSRNSEERFGFDDENPLMCIVLLSIESETYPA